MICVDRVRGDCDGDADDAKEHVNQRPPRVVWVCRVNVRDDGADKSNEPCNLSLSATDTKARGRVVIASYYGNRDCCKCKRITDNVPEIELLSSTIGVASTGLHLMQ